MSFFLSWICRSTLISDLSRCASLCCPLGDVWRVLRRNKRSLINPLQSVSARHHFSIKGYPFQRADEVTHSGLQVMTTHIWTVTDTKVDVAATSSSTVQLLFCPKTSSVIQSSNKFDRRAGKKQETKSTLPHLLRSSSSIFVGGTTNQVSSFCWQPDRRRRLASRKEELTSRASMQPDSIDILLYRKHQRGTMTASEMLFH